jgi:hypothetical protein
MIQGKNKANTTNAVQSFLGRLWFDAIVGKQQCVVNFNGLAGLGGGNPLSNVLLYPVHYQIYRVLINEI